MPHLIRVLHDDLATLAVDAVVRAADEMLGPASPGAARLDERAGEQFAALCRVAAPLGAGAAVVTGAGALAAPFVLHVVIRDQDGPARRDGVRRALVAAWQRAADWGLATVAAPLVGADAGTLSAEEAASLLVETFEARAVATCPRELHLVTGHDEERALVESIVTRRRG
ncbi:MAG TPA: macro domain-containing protein [Gemmatimonadales bacterium]|nr:macro domain-containing protein [Gemmatimonadales bacterium]